MSVRNRIALLLALSTLSLLVACGGSSSPKANPVGFGNGNLSGTYVFSSSGVDANGAFLTVAGTLAADGKGTITGGTMDVVGVEVAPPAPVAQSITGSYTVGTDGRGQANVSSSVGKFTFDFVLSSNSHGLVTEFDGNGTGSGTIDLQTALTGLSQLQGSYAFSFAGVDSSLTNPFATAGAFTLDSTGDITAGVEDFNEAGITFLNQPLSDAVAATVGSGTAPGSIALNTAFGQLTFDIYPIDAAHLKFIETDSTEFLAGDAFSQTGASIPTGQMVFTMVGGVSAPIAVGGVMTSTDGTGNFTGGLEDVNENGTVSGAQLQFSGIPAAAAGVGGRVVVNLTGFLPATQIVIYPFASPAGGGSGLLMLETDAATVSLGAAYPQTSTTLASSQNYGLNLSAFNLAGFEEDDIAQFTTTSSGFTGIVDVNDAASPFKPQSLAGTYPIPIDSTGRGGANTNFFNYYFYVVNGSTFLLLETDSNQVGAGTFELQSSPSAGAAQPAISMFRPVLRAHSALRRRK